MINLLKEKYTANKNRGFTLIELIVVMAVIAVLVLLAVPRFMGQTEKAKMAQIQNDVKVAEMKVSEELIDGTDVFDGWPKGKSDGELKVLASNGELYGKGGPVNDSDIVEGEDYRVLPRTFIDKEIRSRLEGTFYADSGGKVYYENGKGPGYSDEEIDDLKNKGFIPVATAEELNNVRSATLETYGKGTKWEGEYLGGLDKYYIQVADIDLSGYSGEGWAPIGTETSSFTGTYDGGSYVIRGLEVQGEDEDNQGLFGYADGATIRNVGLIDNKVTGSSEVGGLVGEAGRNSTIENSYATGSVTGSGNVGGLVGKTGYYTEISNSYATGSVTGTGSLWAYSGGLVGYAQVHTKISNSYFTGEVTGSGDGYVGGLVGSDGGIIIESSYVTGSVEGSGDNVGGLVGDSWDSTIESSYATGEVTGTKHVGGLVGRAKNTKIINSYSEGPVTGSNQVGGLIGRAKRRNEIINSYFTGSVTGGSDVGGLVGEVDNHQTNSTKSTTISNSYTTGSVTGSGSNVGGLVGMVDKQGHLISEHKISNSYATGEVTGKSHVGGLVGQVKKGGSTINNSYFEGSVTGTGERVGGLMGYATSTEISNTYATGSVKGSSRVGGLVGLATNTTKISNSYATGPVTHSWSDYVGGLAGNANSDTPIINSYWDINTTGQASSYGGGGEGKTTNDMMKQTTYSGWDFDTVWKIDGNDYPKLR